MVVYFDYHPELRAFPKLVVTNTGATAAHNVRLSFDPPLRSSLDAKGGPALSEVGMISDGIPTLAPGMSLSTLFDSMMERPKEWECTYRTAVAYSDHFGEDHEDVFMLDLGAMRDSTYIEEKGLHSLNHEFAKLNQEFSRMRSGFGGATPIVTESRSEMLERQRRERDARKAERTARSARTQGSEVGPSGPAEHDAEDRRQS